MVQIKFWRTVFGSYTFVLSNFRRFFDASGIWLISITLLFICGFLGERSKNLALIFISIPLLGLAKIAGTTAFAVVWHRLILVDDRPEFLRSFRFGKREFRFLFNAFLIGCANALVGCATVLLIYIIANQLGTASWLAESSIAETLLSTEFHLPNYMAIFIAAIPVAGLVCARLNLALPAIAIDEQSEVLDRTWSRGKNNSVRVWLGLYVVVGPIQLVVIGTGLLIGKAFGTLSLMGVAYLWFFNTVDLFLVIALCVSFLSISFKQLIKNASATSTTETAGLPIA